MERETGSDLESEFDIDFEGELPDSVDRAAIERMRVVAKVFDQSVKIPGTNFSIGADPVLGVLPVAGDVVSAGFSLYIVLESARLGVSFMTLLQMIANVTIDVAGGSIPYAGTIFDAFWKANVRNLELALEDLATTQSQHQFDAGSHEDAVEIEIDD